MQTHEPTTSVAAAAPPRATRSTPRTPDAFSPDEIMTTLCALADDYAAHGDDASGRRLLYHTHRLAPHLVPQEQRQLSDCGLAAIVLILMSQANRRAHA